MTKSDTSFDYTTATQLLANAIGGGQVLTDEPSRFRASYDNLRVSVTPDAVIIPRNEADIAIVLQLANKHKVPVTARGAGSGVAGSAIPLRGGWVVSLAHWQSVEIDSDSMMAYVQPGASIRAINEAAAQHGLFYPPDPSSLGFSTIGGNISTNANGPHTAKYGVCRDYVYGLEGFLPTGKFVSWGGSVRKNSSGYNIKDLWIGAEGTLGIITRAVLKLVPRPAARHAFVATFATEDEALAASTELLASHLVPAAMEIMEHQVIKTARESKDASVHILDYLDPEQPEPVIILLELDGHPAMVGAEAGIVRAWAEKHALACRETGDPGEIKKLWHSYDTCSLILLRKTHVKYNQEIVLPMRGYASMARFIQDLRAEIQMPVAVYGHVADGNFHFNIIFDHNDKERQRVADEAVDRLMRKVIELKGVISGKFGIGLAKNPFLTYQHTDAEIEAMLAIRNALDPNRILAINHIVKTGDELEPAHLSWDVDTLPAYGQLDEAVLRVD